MAPEFLKRKILLLGDGAVGKTSLIRRFVVDKFSDEYITTIGAKVTKKDMRIESGISTYELSLVIWDVLGQRGFRGVQDSAFQGSRGVVLVMDSMRFETAESIKNYWAPRVRDAAGQVKMVLFANKIDLVPDRLKAEERIAQMAGELGCEYLLTSAKTGEGVENGFKALANGLIEAAESKLIPMTARQDVAVAGDIVSVADRIMVDFCNDFGGVEAGTPVLREQFTRAGLDISNPTMDSLLKAIDLLAGVEKSFKSDEDVEKNKERWLKWIEDVKKP